MIIDTFGIYEAIASTLDDKTAKTLTGILTHIYTDIQQMATRQDFNELKAAVSELVEAQKRSEGRIDRLEQAIIELTEAQRHTEQRLAELTEAQRHTEQKLAELTEAQRQTEQNLSALIKRVDIIEERLEGISDSVGYSLENNAYRALPKLLANRGIHVKQRLKRCYINGYQVNIFGTAQRDGKDILIFGECKTRPSKKEIDRFVRITDKLCQTKGCEDRILLVVAHDLHPTVEKYLLDKDIMYFWSYELDSD